MTGRLRVPWLLACLAGACTSPEQPVAAGSARAPYIRFEYAIFFQPAPAMAPLVALERALGSRTALQRVAEIPKDPRSMSLQAHVENDVAGSYAPPDLGALKYFGRGLTPEQAAAVQKSRQVVILDFGHPQSEVWRGLRQANEIVHEVAKDTGGLIWDEESQELFTPEAWNERRLSRWTDAVPVVADHTTIHSYQDGEYVRAITLGMKKLGLPDVVFSDFPWSSGRAVGNTINLLCQAMAEGARFEQGAFDLEIRKIRHPKVRDAQLENMEETATAIAHLTLSEATAAEGDPENRLIQIGVDRYAGNDLQARQDAMLASLFGSKDSVTYVRNDDLELQAASEKAKTQLPALRDAFNAGLRPGEYILVKAPFRTPDNGNEWMWVEVTRWKGTSIRGSLQNDPDNVPGLHSGQIVDVSQNDVFDYMRVHPDGRQEGNTTGEIITRMSGQ